MNRVSTRGDRKNDRIPILFTISVLLGIETIKAFSSSLFNVLQFTKIPIRD
ncbi:hypothetical protein [Nostoc sp.]|uniref:hypothetical protein n=1 Tax=Nostoc sp. TaxID=1180 RepID=UPI002FF13EDD